MENVINIVNVSGACQNNVAVFSHGMWNLKPGETILQHALVRFHLQLLSMFLLAAVFHFFLKRLHFSRFTSDILAGIVLGPNVMGRYFDGNTTNLLFPAITPNQVMGALSKIGYMFFVFFAGLQMDTTLIGKTGRKAFFLGLLIFVTNYAMGYCVEYYFPKNHGLTDSNKSVMIISGYLYFVTMIHTEFVAVSYLLMQLKIMNSQLGRFALASSMNMKLLSLSFEIVNGILRAKAFATTRTALQNLMFTCAYLLFIVIVLRKMVVTFIKRTPEGERSKEIYATITVTFVLLLGSSGDSVGLNYLFGPLIFGFIVPARSPLAEILLEKFNTVVSGFLLPIMTMFCASKIDLEQFIKEFKSLLIFKISLIGFAIKLAVTFGGVLLCKMPYRHASALAVVLNAKGVYEVGNFISYYALKDIHDTSGILLIFMLQAFQPLLVKILYHPSEHYVSYKEKKIENAASGDAELHVLVCAHREEDAMAAVTILQHSNPTKQSPLSIYALCLEELVSSFIPVIVNHQLGQKISSSDHQGSRSQPIIDVFNYFKSQHNKLVQVHVFTAISPFKQMHEDVCWVSFDKGCSLIIIPFHKKWNSKGKLVSSTSTDLRNLNINVLENAPCSVGILIDRKRTQVGWSDMYRVAVLFVGGSDDREAIAYALRMARNPRVHLTILHFIAAGDDVHNWVTMVNHDFLRHLKADIIGHRNISIEEETVRDGSDTYAVIISMAGNYDLIMVGRQHENDPKALSGLSTEWIDFPELGPIGDLLASESIANTVSVLVVQQHKKKGTKKFRFNQLLTT